MPSARQSDVPTKGTAVNAPAATAPSAAHALPYRQFALLIATQLCFGASWSTFLLLPKFLTVELHASPAQIGLVSAVPSLVATIAVPFVGPLIDRIGRRALISAGSLLTLVYAAAFAWVDRIGPLLFLLQLIGGLAFVLEFNAASAQAVDLAPRARMSQVLGFFGASNVVTNALAPAIGEKLSLHSGWDSVFMLSTVMAVLAVALSFTLRSVDAGVHAAGDAAAPPPRQGPITLYVLSMIATGIAFAIAFAFYQPFALSLGMHEVYGFFVGYAGSVVVTRVLLGWVPDRIGRMRTAVLSLALYALVIMAMSQLAPGTLLIYGALLGFAHGFLYPSMSVIAIDDGNHGRRGAVLTYLNGGFQLGYTLGVLVFGWIAERAGYPIIFVLGGTIMLLATLGVARTAFLRRKAQLASPQQLR